MNFKKMLLEINTKVKGMDIEYRKIIVWGMGYIATLYENAFKAEGVKIYAYTGKNALNSEGGGRI